MSKLIDYLAKISPYYDKVNCFYLRAKKGKMSEGEFRECFLHLVDSKVEKETHIEK